MGETDRTQGRKYLTEHLDAYIGRGNRRFHTMIPQEYHYMDFPNLKPTDIIDLYDRHVCVEESVDISLRESDFQRLLDVLGYFQINGNANFRMKELESRVAFERTMRDRHPGVKKAYERYRILLDMVAEGKDIAD
jgi:hypothetical protein